MSDTSERDDLRMRYRYLFKLLVVYFGEDWFDEYTDEAAAVGAFVGGSDEFTRQQTLRELMILRRESATPKHFERAFSTLSWAYVPGTEPTAYGEFAGRLEQAIAASLGPSPTVGGGSTAGP